MASATNKLKLAERHLERVQAACLHYGTIIEKRHPARAAAAEKLAAERRLEDVADLLLDLNELRKSVSYGDVEGPELAAEETAGRIESYINAVAKLIESGNSS